MTMKIASIGFLLALFAFATAAHADATSFAKNLYPGMHDPEVVKLQRFLNTHGYPLASAGPGSYGFETDYFGPLTRGSLAAFQSSYSEWILIPAGITAGTGNFGSVTRAMVNKALATTTAP